MNKRRVKRIFIIILCAACYCNANGKTIDEGMAHMVAFNYYKIKTGLAYADELKLAYSATSQIDNKTVTEFYVYNRSSSKGFIIVSADDNVIPGVNYNEENSDRQVNLVPGSS
jgi:hypothetical protein